MPTSRGSPAAVGGDRAQVDPRIDGERGKQREERARPAEQRDGVLDAGVRDREDELHLLA